jgi:hypothetical protein
MMAVKNGIFTVSLDCEGKWGVADHLSGVNEKITQDSLDDAYAFIFDTLASYDIRATVAFTSLFTQSEVEISSYYDHMAELAAQGHLWYRPICRMIADCDYDGWLGEKYFKRAKSLGHEVAWHGFSHNSLSDGLANDVAAFELHSGLTIAKMQGLTFKSMVFPRNIVGQRELLASNGFSCYRNAQSNENNLYGINYFRVLDEFNIFKSAQRLPIHNDEFGLACLPSGFFLNWPNGPRARIPDSLTVMRWRHLLRDAARRGGQVHLWFHPHNLITAPRMKKTFLEVIKCAADLIRFGYLENRTMIETFDQSGGV